MGNFSSTSNDCKDYDVNDEKLHLVKIIYQECETKNKMEFDLSLASSFINSNLLLTIETKLRDMGPQIGFPSLIGDYDLIYIFEDIRIITEFGPSKNEAIIKNPTCEDVKSLKLTNKDYIKIKIVDKFA
jgi:hypothetical protein